MRRRALSAVRPRVERFEERSMLSGGLMMIAPAGPGEHAPMAHTPAYLVTAQGHRVQHHRPPSHHGGGGGPGGTFFDCAAIGYYNFAIVTITNISTSWVNFAVLAKPCPDRFVAESLPPGGTMWFYTHFPNTLPPSFQVDLGGLNSYTPKPNIVPNKLYPQFVYQITPAMGSQYQIVQTSPGVFALQPAS
jgi:hypothetical protein